MTKPTPDTRPMQDPEGKLEQALIEEFLKTRGYSVAALDTLPKEQVKRLLTDASVYAAGRLAEVEARAHFVEDLHRRSEE